jgi:soluble lytic murein transglycosylase
MLTLLLAFCTLSLASPLPAPSPDDPTVLVGPALIESRISMTPALLTALGARNHADAILMLQGMPASALDGRARADHGFLLAWSLLRADRAKEAIELLGKVQSTTEAPKSYRLLTEGEILLAAGRPQEAAARLSEVPAGAVIAPRAWLQAAAAWTEAGATKKAMDIYSRMADRPDPAEGSEVALMALATKKGLSSPRARPYLRRLWLHYPFKAQGRAAAEALKAHHPAPSPTLRAERAERLMNLGAYQAAIITVDALGAPLDLSTELGCRTRFAYGRSLFKRNDITRAAQILREVGEKCTHMSDEVGAPAFYIAGKSLERKKQWSQAARAYSRIPVLYPDHSMADDGYALAGIAWQEVGGRSKAQDLWTKQVETYPHGDLAAEGFWRLAWTHYLAGSTDQAISWAERMVREVPLGLDPVHRVGGRYWAARWRIYPDVDHPTTIHSDSDSVAAGIAGLQALCTDHPTSYYAILAASRLAEIAPEALAKVPTPKAAKPSTTWTVRLAFLDHPATKRGMALARLGLSREAEVELRALGKELTPSERTILTDIRSLADRVQGHSLLHRYLKTHPPSTLGPDRDRILVQAYPDLYWDLILEVTDGFRYDPRVFHALVREESSFNPNARSWAGARGLSQLMPRTARGVAAAMRMRVTNAQLNDPRTNLRIGSWYLNKAFKRYQDNAFLAVASYNAGPGNVGKWLDRFGDLPTDEFVERIPIRETRDYVRRVLGTYQLYRVLYDPDPAFPDWQHTNHRTRSTSG